MSVRFPRLQWDCGTAYELFVSLIVLHDPEKYGLRASWAAGIRSRIPAAERRFLEEFIPFLDIPVKWIGTLPEPRDAITVLWALRRIPPAERWKTLGPDDCEKPICQVVMRVMAEQAWKPADLEMLLAELKTMKLTESPYDRDGLTAYLERLAHPVELGEMLLSALQAYNQAFFEEEEKRLTPVLKAGLEKAQALAQTLNPIDLLTEISQGVHYDELMSVPELVLIPAFWNTPLVFFLPLSKERTVVIFGARPTNMAAVPGEAVPDGLVRTLKALADPTRLKILHYLASEEVSPSELARRLHLRAPTVTHHLNELRLAGLVNLTVKGAERLYSARREALPGTFETLSNFLDRSGDRLSEALDANMKSLEEKLDNL